MVIAEHSDGMPEPSRTRRSRADRSEMRIVSARVPLRQRVRDIYRYRELLDGLTRKELKVRYKNSVLGFLWSLLNPAVVLLVYYIVFQLILKNGIPYFAIYLIAGILPWNVFSTGTMGACGSVVANSALVKKVAFPREILPLASVGAALVNFFLQAIVLIGFLAAFRRGPAVEYLPLLVPALIALLLLTGAIGVLMAALNVVLRDMQHLLDIGLQVWFWATPIVYPYELVATRASNPNSAFHWLFYLWRLNPVTPIVLTFQRALYGATTPKGEHGVPVAILPPHAGPWWYLWQLLIVIGFSLGLFVIAFKVFGRLEGNFAEEL
jgi:ABC-2 type transport system permease protein